MWILANNKENEYVPKKAINTKNLSSFWISVEKRNSSCVKYKIMCRENGNEDCMVIGVYDSYDKCCSVYHDIVVGIRKEVGCVAIDG